MFVRAGNNIEVFCDDDARVLRVSINISPTGWMEMWREVAPFQSEEMWLKSRLAKRVTDERIQEMIQWFWYDCRNTV